MESKISHQKKTVGQVVKNYQTCAQLSVAPLTLSYNLITTPKKTLFDLPALFKKSIGWLIFPSTVMLTPVTTAIGFTGAALNTGWGAVAIPTASMKDYFESSFNSVELTEEKKNNPPPLSPSFRSSTTTIVSSMPDTSISPEALEQNLSELKPCSLDKTNLSVYSEHTRNYLNRPPKPLSEKIKELKLNKEEEKLFKSFVDPITQEFIDIPVNVNEIFYDLNTIKELTFDPFTGEEIKPQEIQSGRKLILKFEQTVSVLNQMRNSKSEIDCASSHQTLGL